MLLSKHWVLATSILVSASGGLAATALPAPGNLAVSVNFASNHASLDGWSGVLGAYPVDAARWMNVPASGVKGSIPTETVAEALTDNTGTSLASTSLQVCSNGASNYQNGSADSLIGRLMYGYLDDANGSNYAGFQVTGVPYRNYAVVIYFNTDSTTTNPFPAYRVNGAYYRGDSAAQATVSATAATQWWGVKSTTALTEGCNYLVVTGFDNTVNPNLTVEIPAGSVKAGHRATISGFQLVDTTPATTETYTATLSGDATFSAIAWDGGKTWANNPAADVTLTLPAGATLTLDGSLAMRTVTLVSPGAVSIKNSTTSLSIIGWDLSRIGALEFSDETIGWKPSLIAAPPAYLYTASAATLNVGSGFTYELQAGTSAAPAAYTALYNGGALIINTGHYALTAASTSIQTALTIRGNPEITVEGGLEIGMMTVAIESGTINAPWYRTATGANYRPNTITHTGGDIIISDSGSGATSPAPFMLGHWNYGKTIYNLSGGSIQAENGGLRFGHDSDVDLTISGGLLAVTDINGKGSKTTTLTLSGGELRIGAGGFAAFSNCAFTLAGGMLSASASNLIEQRVIAAEGTTSTLSAVPESIMKLSNLTGSGSFTIAAGAVEIDSSVENLITVAEGAVLRVCLTSAEETGSGKVMDNVTLQPGATITFIKADGSGPADGTTSGTTYTPASMGKVWATGSGAWSVGDSPANWSDAASFANGNNVLFRDQPSPAEITVNGALSPGILAIAGGNLTFNGGSIATTATLTKTEAGTATFNQPVNPARVQIDGGQLSFTSSLGSGGSFGSADQTLAVAKEATLHLDIPAETTQVMTAPNRSGTGTILKTGPGTLHLTGNNNAAFGGTVRVAEGTLLLNTGSSSGPLYRNVIEVTGSNSVAQLTVANAVTWSGAAEPQRMILKDGVTMQVKARNPIHYKWEISDATIHVTGGDGSPARGLDFYNGPTLTVSAAEGATAEEPSVSRITGEVGNQFSATSVRGSDATIDVAENARLDIAIPVRNVDANRGFIKNGLGTLRFSGEDNAYTGPTTVNAGIVEVLNSSSLGKGAVVLAANATLKLDALESDQTLANSVISGSGTIAKYGEYTTTIPCVVSNTLAIATHEGTLKLIVADGIDQEVAVNRRSGSGTLLKTGPGELRLSGTKAGVGSTRATEGTLTLDYSGSQGPLYGNTIEVSGEGTLLRLPNANSTAYGMGGDSQRLIAKDGATIRFENRSAVYGDVWELCGGIIELAYATTDSFPRCLDCYYGPTITISAAEDATAENPTVSRVIDPNAKGGGIAIREGNATINTAANALFSIEVPVTRYQDGYGLIKRGPGTLLLANANNTYSGVTTVEDGLFMLNGTHTDAGDYTIAEGAALGGTGTLTLADSKALTFAKTSRFVKPTDAQDEALTLNGTLVLPEIETDGDRITVAFNPTTAVKRGQPYYLLKTELAAGDCSSFKAENPEFKINQNATGLFIYQPAGLLISLY